MNSMLHALAAVVKLVKRSGTSRKKLSHAARNVDASYVT